MQKKIVLALTNFLQNDVALHSVNPICLCVVYACALNFLGERLIGHYV